MGGAARPRLLGSLETKHAHVREADVPPRARRRGFVPGKSHAKRNPACRAAKFAPSAVSISFMSL